MQPINIRGKLYPSVVATARALGVSERNIYKHLDLGTPHLIGLNKKTGPKPCEIDGVQYPSLTAAAAARGVSVEAIRQRVNRQGQKRGE